MGSIDPERVLARVRLRDGGPWLAPASYLHHSLPFATFATTPSLLCGVTRLIVRIVHLGSERLEYYRAPEPASLRAAGSAESCQVQVYLAADQSLSARLEFTEGSAVDAGALNSVTTRCSPAGRARMKAFPTAKPTALLTVKRVWASLPESGRAFIQGFVASVVRQKEADGFEVVATYFAARLDSGCAFDLGGKPPPSAEGGAGALCTGTPAPTVLCLWHCK